MFSILQVQPPPPPPPGKGWSGDKKQPTGRPRLCVGGRACAWGGRLRAQTGGIFRQFSAVLANSVKESLAKSFC
jgi:hypothetical protein